MASKLVVVSKTAFASYELPTHGAVVLGRSQQCDIKIDDPSVTRRHARLQLGDRIEIEDLGSINGTRVREERLVPGSSVELFAGETFHLGTALLMIQAPSIACAAAAEEELSTRRAEPGATALAEANKNDVEPIVLDPAMLSLYALIDRIA